MKKILTMGIILCLFGCSNKEIKKEKKVEIQYKRIDMYGKYSKDNLPISHRIDYLRDIVDVENYNKYFYNYSEKNFLNFYKDLNVKGNGDKSTYWRWKFIITEKGLERCINRNLLKIAQTRPREVLTLRNGNWTRQDINFNPVGKIKKIAIVQRGISGIIIKIIIEGENGTYLVEKEGNIRKLLNLSLNNTDENIELWGARGGKSDYEKVISKNPSMLPSAYFALEKDGNKYIFYGGGFGHGVGIPQWSAMDLTKNKGYSYRKVINRYYPETEVSKNYLEKKVRVGISTTGFSTFDHNKIILSSQKGIKIKGKRKSIETKSGEKVEITKKNGKIIVIKSGKEVLSNVTPIKITSKDRIAVLNIKRNVKGGIPKYRGDFEVKISHKTGKLNLINEIEIEDYLLQVVPSEMPKTFGKEALKVQAIAARTYAVKDIKKGKYKNYGFDILDSVQSQVYNNSDENLEANEAIKETKGQILIYKNKPIEAKYFSTSSGILANSNNVW